MAYILLGWKTVARTVEVRMDAAASSRSIRNNFLLRALVVLTFLDAILTTIILEWMKVEEGNRWLGLAQAYTISPVLFVVTKFIIAFGFIKFLDTKTHVWTQHTYLKLSVFVITLIYLCLVATQAGFIFSVARG